MSHDTHFLTRLERLKPGELDWAMSLYRNAALVKEIVRALAPEQARVAIAIADASEPAHVLVASDGAFVTCLAPGMRHSLPVITRSAIEQAAKDRTLLRELLDEKKTRSARTSFQVLFENLDKGPYLSREMAVELRAWMPAATRTLYGGVSATRRKMLISRDALRRPESLKPRHDEDVRRHWRMGWKLGHLIPLCAVGVRGAYSQNTPALIGARNFLVDNAWATGIVGVVLRGIWTIADMAYETIDDQESAYLEVGKAIKALPAAFTLVATALRVPALRPRVEAIIARDYLLEEPLDDVDHEQLARLRDVLRDPSAALLRHLAHARAWADAHLPGIELDDKQVLAASLYSQHILVDAADHEALTDRLPFIAASAYEDLYLPEEVLARWPRQKTLVDAYVYAEMVRGLGPVDKRPPPPAPGRNEPCHCGSGRKFKKCHGAVEKR